MQTIAALIFPDFELLDLCGPMEFFGLLPDDYQITLVAEEAGPVQSYQKVPMIAEKPMSEVTSADILFVPGGIGTRDTLTNQPLLDWIVALDQVTQQTLSVCTGAGTLAKAGVLDGRRATSNKAAFNWITSLGPNVDWVKQARWVEDGKYFTSSGVSAGMDMTLAVIAKNQGLEMAEKKALWAEYQWHKDPDWDPFAKHHGLVP